MNHAANARITEMAYEDADFARHAALMESMRAPTVEPILRSWKNKAELLRDAFTDEALRRMARKAGVESATQKGALAVNGERRCLAHIMLRIIDAPMIELVNAVKTRYENETGAWDAVQSKR